MSLPLGLQTALISAATAAVVTLLIEYAAKPHLEARKDRVVERYRNRRDFERRLISVAVLARSMYDHDVLDSLVVEIRSAVESSLSVAHHVPFLKWKLTSEFLRAALRICEKSPEQVRSTQMIEKVIEQIKSAQEAWRTPSIRWIRPLAYATLDRFRKLRDGNHLPY